MKIIISPAKSLNEEIQNKGESTSPALLNHSAKLITVLKKKSISDLATLMKISPKLAELNYQRFQKWNKNFTNKNAVPSIFAFEGDVYQGINISSYNKEQLKNLQKKLFILSGLYGALRPLDLMKPYRLEMGTKLATQDYKNLYEFWGDTIANYLMAQCKANETIINLASNEYFTSIKKHLKNPVFTPIFQDQVKGVFKTVSFWAKRARGLMVSFIIKNKINNLDDLREFQAERYFFKEYDSKKNTMLFQRKH